MCMYVCTCAFFESHSATRDKDFFGLYVMRNVSKETYIYGKRPEKRFIKITHMHTCNKGFFGLYVMRNVSKETYIYKKSP